MGDLLKIRMRPTAHFGTALSSDTLFGALCWAVKYTSGDEFLEKMLAAFRTEPPFLISSASPEGMLPRPIITMPAISFDRKKSRRKQTDAINRQKELQRVVWLPISVLRRHQKSFDIGRALYELSDAHGNKDIGEYETTRTAINRETLTVLDGSLFTESYRYVPKEYSFTVYVKILDAAYTASWFQEIFTFMGSTGIGKDSSTGKGQFFITLVDLTEDERALFGFAGDHFFSLSMCAGSNLSPLSYKTFTRYGKIGGEFSQAGIDGRLTINKHPVVFYREGSVFLATAGNGGGVVTGVHPDQRIVQYGWAFPVYFALAGGNHANA